MDWVCRCQGISSVLLRSERHIVQLKHSPIPFEIEKLNTGGAMNLASGVFTAPKSGTYFFSFSGVAHISASSSAPLRLGLFIHLYRNGIAVGSGEADDYSVTDEHETTSIHIQSTLDLKIGDRIYG